MTPSTPIPVLFTPDTARLVIDELRNGGYTARGLRDENRAHRCFVEADRIERKLLDLARPLTDALRAAP